MRSPDTDYDFFGLIYNHSASIYINLLNVKCLSSSFTLSINIEMVMIFKKRTLTPPAVGDRRFNLLSVLLAIRPTCHDES